MAIMIVKNVDGIVTKIELDQRYYDFMAYELPPFINSITLDLVHTNLLTYRLHKNGLGEYVNAQCQFTMDETNDLEYMIAEG